MLKKDLPFRRMIFVCTNAREPGARISCAGEGRCGEQILSKLKDYVKVNKLEDQVRVAKSGCQEQCEQGPNLTVLPENDYLTQLSLSDVPSVIDRYLTPLIKNH